MFLQNFQIDGRLDDFLNKKFFKVLIEIRTHKSKQKIRLKRTLSFRLLKDLILKIQLTGFCSFLCEQCPKNVHKYKQTL